MLSIAIAISIFVIMLAFGMIMFDLTRQKSDDFVIKIKAEELAKRYDMESIDNAINETFGDEENNKEDAAFRRARLICLLSASSAFRH